MISDRQINDKAYTHNIDPELTYIYRYGYKDAIAEMREAEHKPLQLRISDWEEKTFPDGNSFSLMSHLAKEIIELNLAVNGTGNIAEELADCLHLLFGIASKNGIDLLKATEEKFAINQKRQWGTPDENGVVEHIR